MINVSYCYITWSWRVTARYTVTEYFFTIKQRKVETMTHNSKLGFLLLPTKFAFTIYQITFWINFTILQNYQDQKYWLIFQWSSTQRLLSPAFPFLSFLAFYPLNYYLRTFEFNLFSDSKQKKIFFKPYWNQKKKKKSEKGQNQNFSKIE